MVTDRVVFGGVTKRREYVRQLVALPTGLSVPSTMADADSPGAMTTSEAICPAPPR